MGWSEVAARSHARRLEQEGWLTRTSMTRGEGSLFTATRTGVAMAQVQARPATAPSPTWWAHQCATAWTVAWLTARGREFVGARELIDDRRWSGEISWSDAHGRRRAGHSPDLLWSSGGTYVPVEVELTRKSLQRLRAILALYLEWWRTGRAGGVIYICGDVDLAERVSGAASGVGLSTARGGGLRIELLATAREQALSAYEVRRRTGRPARCSL